MSLRNTSRRSSSRIAALRRSRQDAAAGPLAAAQMRPVENEVLKPSPSLLRPYWAAEIAAKNEQSSITSASERGDDPEDRSRTVATAFRNQAFAASTARRAAATAAQENDAALPPSDMSGSHLRRRQRSVDDGERERKFRQQRTLSTETIEDNSVAYYRNRRVTVEHRRIYKEEDGGPADDADALRWGNRVYVHLKKAMEKLVQNKTRLRLYVYGYAIILRLALIIYGSWQDVHLRVKYTDVDYKVFTDAAALLFRGESPYQRHTYRYSPLLALLCTVNVIIHPAAAKLLFAAADILLCYLSELLLLNPPWAPDNSSSSSMKSANWLLAHSKTLTRRNQKPKQVPHQKYATRILANEFTAVELRALLLPAACWTFYPVAAVISTRGNADVLPCLLTLLLLFALRKRRYDAAAICFGLAVHMKMYPAIYGVPLLLFLRYNNGSTSNSSSSSSQKQQHRALWRGSTQHQQQRQVLQLPLPRWSADTVAELFSALNEGPSLLLLRKLVLLLLHQILLLTQLLLFPFSLAKQLLLLLNLRMWRFGLISVFTFFALGGIFYNKFGWPFIYESYLHHFLRRDIRHNFSVFFYFFYLSSVSSAALQRAMSVAVFMPQLCCCLLVGCFFSQQGKVELALFLQTVMFVALNKVCTSQYFLWWLCLLPFAIASTDITKKTCLQIIGALSFFQIAQFIHLYFCHAVEFEGLPRFRQIFFSSLLLLLSEMGLAWLFILKCATASASLRKKLARNPEITNAADAAKLSDPAVEKLEPHARIPSLRGPRSRGRRWTSGENEL